MTAAQEKTYMDYSDKGYGFHSVRPNGTVSMVKRERAENGLLVMKRIAIKADGSVVEEAK